MAKSSLSKRFSAVCLLCVCLLGASLAAAEQPRPNILLIITDQQSATMMSCTGNTWLETPAMDSLMRRGMRFERAYAANPVCVPSRFSLFTGRYPSAIGIRSNALSGRPLPEGCQGLLDDAMGHVFQRAGYETVYAGKTHLPGAVDGVRSYGFSKTLTGDARDKAADACAEYLHQKHDRPFLLVASFINPHDICYMAITRQGPDATAPPEVPAKGPRDRLVMDEDARIPLGVDRETFFTEMCPPLPDNFGPTADEPRGVQGMADQRRFRANARANWTEESWRMHRWTYCRLTERVDRQIGRVLDALGDAQLEDDTIVVFTSDHGDMDAAHGLEHKSFPYDEAARIPLIVQYPGVSKPGHVDRSHLVSNGLDLLPTLCDLTGTPIPEGLAGHSLRPLIAAEQPDGWRQTLMVETEPAIAVLRGWHKYSFFDFTGPEELLVDLRADPGEMINLAADPANSGLLATMRSAMAEQLKAHGVEPKEPLPSGAWVAP